MFFARPPTDETVRALLRERADVPFSHPHVGWTERAEGPPPAGYVLDDYACDLGVGESTFEAAMDGLGRWRHYATSFTRVVPLADGLEEGRLFATVAAHFGFASVQPCRIVYVDDARAAGRFAFGIGTLPGHDGSGEERFEIGLDAESGRVVYRVTAFSRPASPLASLGRPLMRVVQRRFQRQTRAALQAHCTDVGGTVE